MGWRPVWSFGGALLMCALGGCGGVSALRTELAEARASLSGAQALPALMTPARGTARVRVRPDLERLDVTVQTTLIADITSITLCQGRLGETGPILVTLYTAGTGQSVVLIETPVTAEDFTRLPDGSRRPFAAVADALLAGQTYLLITTRQFPAGELRGQLGVAFADAVVSGQNVLPPVESRASGLASAAVDRLQESLTLTLDTQGVVGVTAVMLRYGAPRQNGPPLFTLIAGPGLPLPPVVTVRLTAAELQRQAEVGVVTFADAVGVVLGGRTYLSVETLAFPEGELRGQLRPR
jgi:hypothetical protein